MKALGHRASAILLAAAAATASALLLAPGRAEAAITSCSVSTSGVAFSPYNGQTKSAVDGTGTITVTCSGSGSNNAAALHITGGSANSCTARVMKNGVNDLGYQIYRDAARTSNFCAGTDRLNLSFTFAGVPVTQTITMYGRVASMQNPAYTTTPYTDSLTVTLRQGTTSSGAVLGVTTPSISGSVAANCTVSAGSLGFGTYNTTTAATATATVTVNCSNGASYQVGLGGGSNLNGSTRRMAGPAGARLSYDLYSNSGRTIAWGDGTALGAKVSGTGSGASQGLVVYGRIPAGQLPTPGSYADSVVVTVDY
jgi:spore coat protein U-like protein